MAGPIMQNKICGRLVSGKTLVADGEVDKLRQLDIYSQDLHTEETVSLWDLILNPNP